MFDKVGRLLILVQVHPSSPVKRIKKVGNFDSQETTTSVLRLFVVLYVVYRSY